jgi:ribosomal-protein-alanine N-acetyltransferase
MQKYGFRITSLVIISIFATSGPFTSSAHASLASCFSFLMPAEIQTKRLIVRKLQEQDAQVYFDLLSDEQVAQMHNRRFFPELIRMRFSRMSNKTPWAPNQEYLIIEMATALPVGVASIDRLKNGVIEIGYLFNPKYWNQGLATEFVAAFSEFAVKEKRFQAVRASVAANNIASQTVLKKSGYKEIMEMPVSNGIADLDIIRKDIPTKIFELRAE